MGGYVVNAIIFGLLASSISGQQQLPQLTLRTEGAHHPSTAFDDEVILVAGGTRGGVALPPVNHGATSPGGVPLPPVNPGATTHGGGGFTTRVDDDVIFTLGTTGSGVPLSTATTGGTQTPTAGGGPFRLIPKHDDDVTLVLNSGVGGTSGGVPLPPVTPTVGHSPTLNADGDFVINTAIGSLNTPTKTPVVYGVSGPSGFFPGVGTSAGVPSGGVVTLKSTDQKVKDVIKMPEVIARLQKETEADSAIRVTEVINAHTQVVSGQLLHLLLKVAETRCPKGTTNVQSCPLDVTETQHICELVVWERSWLKSVKIVDTDTMCEEMEDDTEFKNWGSFDVKRSSGEVTLQALPGHLQEKQIALTAYTYIDHGSESDFQGQMNKYTIQKIQHNQVAKRTFIRVNVEYGFTLCPRSDNVRRGNSKVRACPPDVSRSPYICSVTVVTDPFSITGLRVIPDNDDEILCRQKTGKATLPAAVAAPAGSAVCADCPVDVPATDPSVVAVADFALSEYDKRISDDDDLHMIVKIHKAKTKVISGIMYYLTLELAETDCDKALVGADINRGFCRRDPNDRPDICDFKIVEQSWANVRQLVHVDCHDRDEYDWNKPIQQVFTLPAAPSSAVSQAGPVLQPSVIAAAAPQQPKVDQATKLIAQMVVVEYDRYEDDDNYHKLVRVHQARRQGVASGMKYDLVLEVAETLCHKRDPRHRSGENCPLDPTEEHEVCHVEVYHQAGATPETRILHMDCDDFSDYAHEMALKSLPSLSHAVEENRPFLTLSTPTATSSGGFQSQSASTHDLMVKAAAKFVVQQINLMDDDDDLQILTRIVNAKMQAGTNNYLLELEVAESECKKYLPVADPSRCYVEDEDDYDICEAEVSGSAGTMRLTRIYCDDRDDYYTRKLAHGRLGSSTHISSPTQQAAPSSGTPGPWTSMNPSDPEVKRLAAAVADEFDRRSDEDEIYKVHSVIDAKQQLAAGIHYQMTVELAETVCPKYKPGVNKTRCQIDIGEELKICEAKIWVQPWAGRRQFTDIRCADKDDFYGGDDSIEVVYPKVHPTSHARPVFIKQVYGYESKESRESNEQIFESRETHDHDSRERPGEIDSDEVTLRVHRRPGRDLLGILSKRH